MKLSKAAQPARDEVENLERRLAELEVDLERIEHERARVRKQLERTRQKAHMCPKCGRDRDFLTDSGGYLAHVLEDPNDDELLEDGKPLFCPACGEVFLYKAPTDAAVTPKPVPSPVTNGSRPRIVAVRQRTGRGF